MNSYERVMTAMRLEQPDRVPVVEFLIDPKVQQAIKPGVRDFGELAEHLGLDAVGCNAPFKKVSGNDQEWIDEWGVRYRATQEAVAHPLEGPLSSMEDLRSYTPPDPGDSERYATLREFVSRYKGKRAVICHHRAAFMWACYLTGIDNFLMNLIAEPRFAAAVMDMVAEVNEQIVRNMVRIGADIVTLGDDYATNTGPMFSPDVFKELILPRLQRVVDAIHDEGGMAIKHSDGNIWPLLDMIVGTGADGLNPLEPVAGMDMGEVKAAYGDRICLVGNIDCGALLSHGTVEEVEAAVKDCIAAGAPGGGFMLASSNSIHSSVKAENYVAMVKAGRKYGAYETG